MSAELPEVPAGLLSLTDREPSWDPWLAALPRLAREVVADWELVPDGDAMHGECSLVLPVLAEGRRAVLKLGWPHDEARHEHLALQHWHGGAAVELLRADPHRWALLLERAGPADLHALDDVTACETVGDLYAHLHRPALPQVRRLSALAADWAGRLSRLPRSAPVPHRLVEQAASLARDLAEDDATDRTLVHGDLHFANVLRSGRRARDDGAADAWLVIDPKPLSGDPHVEPAPLLWNRWDEVVASGDVRWAVRRRLDAVVDAAGLDRDRARDWSVVRQVVNALWCVEALDRQRKALDAGAREWITRAVTIAKAVQD
ncbi:aminoglycoside phosphotransferase family protein [Cellulomonas carbonis]|uniref:aminoglycoside phosphotransferase family protein n=1 Tax=Cellulomonas carbonis TaxID=1386092 RepID=UPI000AD6DBBC|nr:aminoglycoside phosphotransferase family protein [Cellulomonas carbonis]GGC08819.1 streptomycin 6-kinase [Cellulomonas carbonis]